MLVEILVAILLICVLVVIFILLKGHKSGTNSDFIAQIASLKTKLDEKESLILSLQKESVLKNEQIAKNAALQASLNEKEKLIEKMQNDFLSEKRNLRADYEQILAQLKKEREEAFNSYKNELSQNLEKQNLAILNQNKIMLSDEGKKALSEIFEPVKKSVKEYSEKLATNETALQTNIKNMFNYSLEIGKKAEELAQILKGDKKVRGNFAELQLKNVLENSGLKEGEQYKLQEHFKDGEKDYYPDAVVHLDKQKSIIIDAKFSLPNDFDFDQKDDEKLCEQICANLKNRIDELAKKPYAKFAANTYDFVLLFIPYQNILDLALDVAPNLYQEAYKKKIYLTTPHTLFMALNTINISWRHIQSDENVQKAFEELGKFYDKFVGVLEGFEAIKRSANSMFNNIQDMQNKMQGRGGLITRVDKLKELGIKTNKSIENTKITDFEVVKGLELKDENDEKNN